jgi:hypothetical protein
MIKLATDIARLRCVVFFVLANFTAFGCDLSTERFPPRRLHHGIKSDIDMLARRVDEPALLSLCWLRLPSIA